MKGSVLFSVVLLNVTLYGRCGMGRSSRFFGDIRKQRCHIAVQVPVQIAQHARI
jgi:hypothetical protein